MGKPTRGKAGRAWRRWRAGWRDTLLLLREFRGSLLAFGGLVIGGGLLYGLLARAAGEPLSSALEAIYRALSLVFLQSPGDFPRAWHLQAFYFVMPVVGLGILAQGLTEFGVLLFNRRARSKEWEMAVASTHSDHIVLVGLGHLGYRVVKQLHEMEQDVVVIEAKPDAETVSGARAMGVPVLHDDARRDAALEAAGIRKARALVLCTQNDTLNLQIAVKARSLNPAIQVVVRIFDDDFAQALQKQFDFKALSATGMAAPTFAAAAAGVDITKPITVEGQALSLARLEVPVGSRLAGRAVGDVETSYEVSVVLLRHAGQSDFHPAAGRALSAGDSIAVIGGPDQLNRLVRDNR
jgi:Trk K+ transport system NAD-binding subunit